MIRVVCSREIAGGSVAICGGRAKVYIGCVMLVGRRKSAYRYVMIGVGCSVDHCGLFTRNREMTGNVKALLPNRVKVLYILGI